MYSLLKSESVDLFSVFDIQISGADSIINMNSKRTYNPKQSPGGNSSLSLSWENKEKSEANCEEEKSGQEFNDRLEKILKAEEKRKQLMKKEVKTSVKVNRPPGGVNNFFLG